MTSPAPHVDPDFSRQVLEDLYTYRRKRRLWAWILWGTLGWLGAHRFYLQREFTGLAMLFTGGGALLWWLADAFLLNRMVDSHNRIQEQRERVGLPPIGLESMPPLDESELGLEPPWIEEWAQRGRSRKVLRFAGDLLVLLVAGSALGATAEVDGAQEALAGVLVLVGVTALGAGPGWLVELPLMKQLIRWSHRLRLFYHHNRPASPPVLLLKPLLAVITAPFRAKDRAEVRLYVELGAAFTAAFLLADLVPELVVPAILPGRSVQLGALLGGLVSEVFVTFFLTYAFATPIGAVLSLYFLTRATHRVPRFLCAFTVVCIAMGYLGD